MRVVELKISDLARAKIQIGFVDENNHTQVRIDCSPLWDDYPSAVPSMTVAPPAGSPYPGIIARDGNEVVWNVTAGDCAASGDGEIQLTFVSDDVVVKSYISKIIVHRSLAPNGEMPDPVADWLTEANTALNAIPQTINDALAEAKASGEFKGDKGDKGDTYELTQEDREEIAHIAEENFSDVVLGYRDDAMDAADRAEQSAQRAGYMYMEIVDGHLIFYRTANVSVADFALVDGHLVMEVA